MTRFEVVTRFYLSQCNYEGLKNSVNTMLRSLDIEEQQRQDKILEEVQLFAFKKKNFELMRCILDKKIDLDISFNSVDITNAVGIEYIKAIKFLLSKGGYIDKVLEIATLCNRPNIIKISLDEGANIEAQDREGNTPLHIATSMDRIEAVETLLANGANIETKGNDGKVAKTVLQRAVDHFKTEIVKILLEYGAYTEARYDNGNTVMHEVASTYNTKIMELLLGSDADKEAQDREGNTALHIAVKRNKSEMVKLLLANGANKEAKNNSGSKPIHIAATMYNTEIMELLLESDVDKEAQDREGNTALHIAILEDNFELVKLLLEKGANKDAQDREGNTVFHKVILKKNKGALSKYALEQKIKIIKILGAYGVDLQIKNLAGKSAFDMASAKGHFKGYPQLVTEMKLCEKSSDIDVGSLKKHNIKDSIETIPRKKLKTDAEQIEKEMEISDVGEDGPTTNIVVMHMRAAFDNPLLKDINFIREAYSILHDKTLINQLIELGNNNDVGEELLLAAKDIGVKKLLEIIFGSEQIIDKEEVMIYNKLEQDQQTLKAIANIESAIGKQAFDAISGLHHYISSAITNNKFAKGLLFKISNIVSSLQDQLDFSEILENIDVENQLSITLAQLENWFDFLASGSVYVGLPSRYPDFDSGDAADGGSNYEEDGNIPHFMLNDNHVPFLLGQNVTITLNPIDNLQD